MKNAFIAAIVVLVAYLIFRWYQMNNAGGGDAAVPSGNTGGTPTLDQWAQAIATQEGYFVPGSRAARNNNPGNLKIAGDAGTDPQGFGVFSTPDLGFAALNADLSAKVQKYPNLSILQIMTRYLGGNPLNPQVTSQGDPFTYAKNVADRLGVSINATLGSIFGSGGGTSATV